MRKTSAYLKGLAENRACLAGDIERLEAIATQIGSALTLARRQLEGCDLLIRRFDGRLDPTLIEPIRSWKGRRGKRGTLQQTIIEIVRTAAPNAVTTTEIAVDLQVKFEIYFESPQAYQTWLHDSVTRRLKHLVARNVLERLHDPAATTVEVGRWRWKEDCAPSLAHLKA
ncbi:MAG TPA: hypothetical protein VGV09_15655, partial [Steroidobacteraceae bacterium]|nr:hypothetical protein [Steroidobacteraceae bacterium]